jgi:hypothetical protein
VRRRAASSARQRARIRSTRSGFASWTRKAERSRTTSSSGSHGAIRRLEQAPDAAATAAAWRILLAGLAEATVPLILAFALLAVAWLLAAVGLRREA